MPFFKIDYPTNQKETDINNSFWEHFDFISKNSQEVFENDLPKEMSNSFRRYGAINQFNKNYHYYKFMLGKPGHDRFTSHRYRTQIIAALLERNFDLDFEVHHYSQEKDEHGKYDDKKVIIIYGDSKDEVKSIHQTFHKYPVNTSTRLRGEIK
jgi:hypothetical protein